MGSDEDTDISESEMSEYEEKSYEELKNGSHNVRISDEGFNCPYCPSKKRKRDYLYQELLQHASGVGQSSSNKRTARDKANHLALAKYLEKDLVTVDGGGSSKRVDGDSSKCENGPSKIEDDEGDDDSSDQDEKFVWPWIGIVVNIPTTRLEDGRCVGASGSKLRNEYREKGFNPIRVNPLWNFRGHSGTALVEFHKDWKGLNNALAFERYYESEQHGKKNWKVDNEPKSGLYGWVARSDDYKKNNIIGENLQKMGDIKTISELQEEEARRQELLRSNLENIIEVKKEHLKEMEKRCNETTRRTETAMGETDKLIQSYNEGIF